MHIYNIFACQLITLHETIHENQDLLFEHSVLDFICISLIPHHRQSAPFPDTKPEVTILHSFHEKNRSSLDLDLLGHGAWEKVTPNIFCQMVVEDGDEYHGP